MDGLGFDFVSIREEMLTTDQGVRPTGSYEISSKTLEDTAMLNARDKSTLFRFCFHR